MVGPGTGGCWPPARLGGCGARPRLFWPFRCAGSAAGTGTKRTECAPPSANARLSNSCAGRNST